MAPAAYYGAMRNVSQLANALSLAFIQSLEAILRLMRASFALELAAPTKIWKAFVVILQAANALYAVKSQLKDFVSIPYFATLVRRAFEQDPRALIAFKEIDQTRPFVAEVKEALRARNFKRAFYLMAQIIENAPQRQFDTLLALAPSIWNQFVWIVKQDPAAQAL